MLGIPDHTSGAAHDSGAAPQAASFLAAGRDWSARFARSIGLRVIDRPAGLEALGRSRTVLVRFEFLLPHRCERTQVGGCCRAVVKGEYLAQFEIEDVASVAQAPDCFQASAGFEKEPTNGAKQSSALEAQVFPIAHALAGLAHHPE